MNDLEITWIGGNCPVQAEGFYKKLPLYFRARGSKWSVEITSSNKNWYYEKPIENAGWLSEEEVKALINVAIKIYNIS